MKSSIQSAGLLLCLFPLAISSLLIPFVIGCAQPAAVADKWGWEPSLSDKTVYEQSLFSSYDKENFAEAKNEWRVLNYMMYFLATELAKTEGDHSQLAEQLDRLQSLDIRSDSVQVMNIYRKIFIDYDTRLDRPDDGSNQFIDSVLAQARLPQILKWGAFDSWTGLDGLGKLITRVGPLEYVQFDENSLKGYGQDGIHYEFTQDEYDNYLLSSASAHGPVDKFDPVGGHPEGGGTSKTSALMRKADQLEAKIKTQHELHISVNYAQVEVQRLNILGLPGPINIPLSHLGSDFYNSPWNARTIDIELYFNIDDIENNDSLDFSAVYKVVDAANNQVVAQETSLFRHDIKSIDGEAFSARILTEPIPGIDSCRVELTVDCNDQQFTHSEFLDFSSGPQLLEIARSGVGSSVDGVPFVTRDPVSRKQPLPLFLTIGDIPFDTFSQQHSCVGVVLLFDTEELSGEAGIDPESFTVLSDLDSLSAPGTDYPTLDKLIAQYGKTYAGSIPVDAEYPNLYLTQQIELPDGIKPGDYLLKIDYYSYVGADRKAVKQFATVSRQVTLE